MGNGREQGEKGVRRRAGGYLETARKKLLGDLHGVEHGPAREARHRETRPVCRPQAAFARGAVGTRSHAAVKNVSRKEMMDSEAKAGRPPRHSFTWKQGQYLAFIHAYSKIHRRPPAEADMRRHFGVTPPTVHQMVINLERHGLISRVPGMPRTIRVLVRPEDLPVLE
ncbi:MAG: hypothetical protein OXN97_01310 [Bryobacterales bacterium]|nr:hypothetical protein [Bryobacterales bacterium]